MPYAILAEPGASVTAGVALVTVTGMAALVDDAKVESPLYTACRLWLPAPSTCVVWAEVPDNVIEASCVEPLSTTTTCPVGVPEAVLVTAAERTVPVP